MNDADKKYVQFIKDDYSGRHMTEQAPEQRLLAIIDRMEEKTHIEGMREAINTNLIEENASLKAENEKLKAEIERCYCEREG